jgi:hypothetical protein
MRFAVTASIILLLASASSLYGDIIVSTYCRVAVPVGDAIEVSSPSGCSVAGPIVDAFPFPATAEARFDAHYEFLSFEGEPEIPEGTFSAYARVDADARYLPGYPFNDYSYARTDVELSFRATSSGPVRSGLIQLLSFGDGRGFGQGSFEATSTVGNLFARAEFQNCTGCQGTLPFVLGQPFDIRVFVSGGGIVDSQETVGGGHGFFNVRFKLRELDGTPVDLLLETDTPVAVPEPSTVLLLAGGLVSLVLARVHGRCRRKRRMSLDGSWDRQPA